MIRENTTHMDNTEQLIRDHLEVLAAKYEFEFSLVNMTDIERRLDMNDRGLLSVLSDEELDHYTKIKLHKNRLQWIAGRYAVKSALFKYKLERGSLMEPSCIDVLKGAESAPYVLQYPGISISITHSHPFCIGVVAERKIGIDIENVSMPDRSLIKHFYCGGEKEALGDYCDSPEYAVQAMIFWTRKEAVSKLLRLGMKMNFKELDTSKDRLYLCYGNGMYIKLASFNCNSACVSLAVEDDN